MFVSDIVCVDGARIEVRAACREDVERHMRALDHEGACEWEIRVVPDAVPAAPAERDTAALIPPGWVRLTAGGGQPRYLDASKCVTVCAHSGTRGRTAIGMLGYPDTDIVVSEDVPTVLFALSEAAHELVRMHAREERLECRLGSGRR